MNLTLDILVEAAREHISRNVSAFVCDDGVWKFQVSEFPSNLDDDALSLDSLNEFSAAIGTSKISVTKDIEWGYYGSATSLLIVKVDTNP